MIDGRNFCDQPIDDLIKQYDEVRKVLTGQGVDYTTGCLWDYAYFKSSCRLIAVDLSKKKALDADLRAIQQIVFQIKLEIINILHYSWEIKSNNTRILQRNNKRLREYINDWIQ